MGDDELTLSNSLLDRPDLLRQRLQLDGYLYLQDIIDPARVMALRGDILQVFSQHDWLVPGRPVEQAITDSVPAVEVEEAFFGEDVAVTGHAGAGHPGRPQTGPPARPA